MEINLGSILTEVILWVLGIIMTAIGGVIAVWVEKYVKDEQLKTTLASFHDLVRNSVLETYQIYVQELKDKDMFDGEAQKTALTACLDLIKANMPPRVEKWLKTNVSDIEGYLKNSIEAQIGALKNSGK